jgi:hypothetical protein
VAAAAAAAAAAAKKKYPVDSLAASPARGGAGRSMRNHKEESAGVVV